MKKVITAVVLMLICFYTLPSVDADAKAKEYTGTCGENATWHWERSGKLTISGTGAVTETGWKNIYKELDNNYTDPEIYGAGYYGEAKFIKSIVIANGITEIGDNIFKYCGIKELRIPDSVKKIGNGAFRLCVNLKSISLPKGLERIEANAFRDCYSLRKITIPSTVTCIGNKAFACCYRMKKFVNQSCQTYVLEQARGKLTWKVGKKKVSIVSAGETATSTGKKYKIKYVLNGGKLKGKRKTSYHFWQDVKLPKARKKGYVFLGWSEAAHSESLLDVTTWGNLKLHAVFKKVSIKKVNGRKIKVSVKPAYSRLVVQYSTQKNFDAKGFWSEDHGFQSTVGRYATDGDTLSGVAVTKKLKKGKTYYLRWGLYCDPQDNIRWFGKKKIKM